MIQINRITAFSLFVLTFLLLHSSVALAQFEVRARVTTDSVIWSTATRVGVGGSDRALAPSQWQTPPTIRSVNSWIPATFAVAPLATGFTVRGGNSNETSAAISISDWGMQYNTGGTSYTGSSVSVGTACSFDSVSASSAELTLKGNVCVSRTKLTTATSTNPFLFYRPIFNVTDSNVINAFKDLQPGFYTGSIPIIVRYYYYSGSILTYRDINETLVMILEYVPNHVSEVTLCDSATNTLIMVPNYVTGTNPSVNSTANCKITVTGYFSDGVLMTMPTDKYELVHTDPDHSSSKIPYSIDCSNCSDSKLVSSAGVLLLSTATPTTKVAGAGVTTVDINLTFKYDIAAEDASGNPQIVDGKYQDQITLNFTPDI